MADKFEEDARKMVEAKKSNTGFISYLTDLKGLYANKPKKESDATPRKRKLMGQDNLDEETKKEL